MEVAAESVRSRGFGRSKVGLDAAQAEVHDGEAARGGVALLAVDADVDEVAAVGFGPFFRLQEHAAELTGGVVDASLVGGEGHSDRHPGLAAEFGGGIEGGFGSRRHQFVRIDCPASSR